MPQELKFKQCSSRAKSPIKPTSASAGCDLFSTQKKSN